MHEFQEAFMPYCIQKQNDGHYVILNRMYKPLGMITKQNVDYSPYAVKLKGLSPTSAKKLSWKGDPNTDEIFLYNDGCVPTKGKKNMGAYLDRLAILASIKVA